MPSDDRFADAVKPALEALLSDLQHTTEVLRRANATSPAARSNDIEPIYQEQTKRPTVNWQRAFSSYQIRKATKKRCTCGRELCWQPHSVETCFECAQIESKAW
ncbi:hypothetical protein NECAME_10363 [Necator americanus]|uniref:Uncharacterized protein n=1 Tax=Necator americanus TaxID=51031 RepID=W2T960_NECAM|nr:hypothetical protein NECAME_10363 [Necator americanus]ETN78393.1 hypothetical protein NECAME_10363 [Necator americanus]